MQGNQASRADAALAQEPRKLIGTAVEFSVGYSLVRLHDGHSRCSGLHACSKTLCYRFANGVEIRIAAATRGLLRRVGSRISHFPITHIKTAAVLDASSPTPDARGGSGSLSAPQHTKVIADKKLSN